ncbi:MAG: SurA N-terminal domain-containing protein [Pseudomonadota bacterium]|nr:SurA N-terminal domain-containing protein [Pseudomonadota bacterium]
MLSSIREKMKIWIVAILLILVAIPLVFMGLGNYQAPQKTYSVIIDDQIISRARLEQEVFQYKRALNQNYKGNPPPIYTDNFIKKITLEYMIRSILLEKAANEMGLKFSDESIINEIKNTSAFKNDDGFNQNLYKQRLISFNMAPKDYERYIFQKGISDQLRFAITDTSFLTQQEQEDLASFRFHKRKGSYILIPYKSIKKKTNVTEKEAFDYFQENSDAFMTEDKAVFKYIDIDKFDLIKSISINETILREIYDEKLQNQDYFRPANYKINHILISKIDNQNYDELKTIAEKAHNELVNGKSFKIVAEAYSNDEETKGNNGYLGEFLAEDLPDYFQNDLVKLKENEISNIVESDKGFHIFSIKEKQPATNYNFEDVKDNIIDEYKTEHGTRLFFDLSDKISEQSFENKDLNNIADTLDLKLQTSKEISETEGYNIFNYDHIRKALFVDEVIKDNLNSELIYVNDNRFIVAKLIKYYPPQNLSFDKSKNAILALLKTQKSTKNILSTSNLIRDNLNSTNKITDYKAITFNLSLNSDDVDSRIKKTIFGSNILNEYKSIKMDNGDYLIYIIDSIEYPKNLKEVYTKDNEFSNFITNTRSESEYTLFQQALKANVKIDINEDYLNSD